MHYSKRAPNEVAPYVLNPPLPLTVTIIGCGGTGSLLLQQLARIAYAWKALTGHCMLVTVVDGDEVDHTNVGRQLFADNEYGYNKAFVAVSRINRFYDFNWIAYPKHFNLKQESLVDSFSSNIVISCTDTVQSRKDVKELIKWAQGPGIQEEWHPHYWIDLGNGKTTGQMVVYSKECGWPDVIDAYGHLYDKEEDNEPSCSIAMSLNKQDLFINQFMADVAAKWIWEALNNPTIDWRGAFVNLGTLQINKIKVDGNAQSTPAKDSQHKKRGSRKPKAVPAGARVPKARRVRGNNIPV
jgi:PRTRC genetic system ThiF family protein